jgi:serine/threonine protein phosphatase PrpC
LEFLSAYHTDVGIKKKANQDSLLLMQADTAEGELFFSVICDGMGGLSKGELVSAATCEVFRTWFIETLPRLLRKGRLEEELKKSWEDLIFNMNSRVLDYSDLHHLQLGTTAVALLLHRGRYAIINVGDSRVYQFADSLFQLTKDQTVVQREVDLGMLSPEEAERDKRRNVLLQCIGASAVIEPEFLWGSYEPGTVFMLCSDGFRHTIQPKELWDHLNPAMIQSEQQIAYGLAYLTDLNKHRREDDNISAIGIKVV